MKKNDYLLMFILIVDFIGLWFLECGFFKWFVFLLFIVLPKLVSFKISVNKTLEVLYLILIFFSFVLGRVYGLYDKIIWFDTLVHFIFGMLSFVFGLVILKLFNRNDNICFSFLFCLMMTLFLGVLWEFIEFIFDYLFHTNMMKVAETGVMDTIKDLSIAGVSNLLTFIIHLFYLNFKNNIDLWI